jgi:hypothetical protein
VTGEHRQGCDWIRGVKVNRRAERSRAFPEGIIGTVIEIFAVRMPVNHGAAELELAHAALEFVSRGLRILHRKVRKARISVGTLLYFLCKEIVRRARSPHGFWDLALRLHAGPGDRKNGPRDAVLVHHLQSLFAEFGKACIELGSPGRCDIDHCRAPIGFGGGIEEMFFQRDLVDHDVSYPRIRKSNFWICVYRILG